MSFQYFIVFLIITFATGYLGLSIWRKSKSFSKEKAGCGSNCGCDSKTNKA